MKLLTINEWADSNKGSSFKTQPFMEPMMDNIMNEKIDRVVIRSAQPQFTELRMLDLLDKMGIPFEEDELK